MLAFFCLNRYPYPFSQVTCTFSFQFDPRVDLLLVYTVALVSNSRKRTLGESPKGNLRGVAEREQRGSIRQRSSCNQLKTN